MRFLMLNWRDPRNPLSGGAERVTLAYLKALRGRGHEVAWFANEFAGAAREEIFDGITIARGGGKGTSILAARRWYRSQKKFDLVIDQHHGVAWFAPWWAQTRCIAYIHEVLGPIWDSFYPWPLSQIGREQERYTHWLYRQVPFWTPSESTRTTLRANGVKQVEVFANGVDTLPLNTLSLKELGQPLQLITVSRLAPNKRIDHAILAVDLLKKQGVDARLCVVGSGEMEGKLRQMAGQLDLTSEVEFTGKLAEDEKNARLANAHFLLHPSIREGWGLNVIEANAMGTPAVVYPVGGLVDSTINGETGWITESETPEALARALRSAQTHSSGYAKMRTQAWERSKTFAWNKVVMPVCDWLEQQATSQ